MPTGYEVESHRNLARLTVAVRRIADSLEHQPPVVLVIRDPDYENDFVIDGAVRIIDVDLGAQFNGSKDFDAESEQGQQWIASTLEQVADLPSGSLVRQRVEDLVDNLRESDG